jgi:hypothetical protein
MKQQKTLLALHRRSGRRLETTSSHNRDVDLKAEHGWHNTGRESALCPTIEYVATHRPNKKGSELSSAALWAAKMAAISSYREP